MSSSKVHVVLLAPPFGFGPLSKALIIATELRERGHSCEVRTDSAATDIVHSAGFSGRPYQYREPIEVDELRCDALVSCMDASTPIVGLDVPFIFVDSLHWLRGAWERGARAEATVRIAQRFLSTKAQTAPQVHEVDGILPRWAIHAQPQERRETLLVYFGGLRSPHVSVEYGSRYLRWGCSAVAEAVKTSGLGGARVNVVAPAGGFDEDHLNPLLSLGATVHSDFSAVRRLLPHAGWAVVSPGIEISLESLAVGIRPLYLPAYNGSHVPQLQAFEAEGIGINLGKELFDKLTHQCVPTGSLSALTAQVVGANGRLLSDDSLRDQVVKTASEALQQQVAPLHRFPLGMNGAQQVVKHIEEAVRG